jgi:hypothetical protein
MIVRVTDGMGNGQSWLIFINKRKKAKFACLDNKSSVIITRLNDQCEKIFTLIMNTIFEALPEEVEGGRRLTVRKMRENLW